MGAPDAPGGSLIVDDDDDEEEDDDDDDDDDGNDDADVAPWGAEAVDTLLLRILASISLSNSSGEMYNQASESTGWRREHWEKSDRNVTVALSNSSSRNG